MPDDIAGLDLLAQHPDIGQAPPRPLTAADLAGDVQIALAPTGAVLGTVPGDAPGERHGIVAVSRADGRRVPASTSDGTFSIPQLPPGDYAVSFDAKSEPEIIAPPVSLHVVAGRTTPVALPRAAVQVGIDITTDEACNRVVVDPAGAVATDGAIASRPCDDHHHGSLERVTPGRYRICNPGSGCAVVDVAPAPARQRVTLGGR